MNQNIDDESHSDQLNLEVKISQIPNAGLGVFAKKIIKSGEILAEYRGKSKGDIGLKHIFKVIDTKYSLLYPFTWEDKMILINNKYCILGRNIAARVNDIVDFNIYSYTQEQIDKIRLNSTFPILRKLSYNTYVSMRQDKAFLVALRDIQKGEELFFNYSFDYWKFFYDLYLQHRVNFFEYWEQEKQKAFKLYDNYIIDDSETLKLDFNNEFVKAKQTIQCSEFILECKGYVQNIKQNCNTVCIKMSNDSKLCLDNFSTKLIHSNNMNSKDSNAELRKFGDKFFIVATYKILQNQPIILYKLQLDEFLLL